MEHPRNFRGASGRYDGTGSGAAENAAAGQERPAVGRGSSAGGTENEEEKDLKFKEETTMFDTIAELISDRIGCEPAEITAESRFDNSM